MPSGSTTRSARAIVRRLRAINPAPASSTSVRATSAVTSHAIHRRSRRPEVGPRVPLVDTSATLAREAWRAGPSPNAGTVDRPSRVRNAVTRPSTGNSIQKGAPSGAMLSESSRAASVASLRPSTPASPARTALSASNCRTMRPRLAPSETRMPTSRERRAARASSRLAALAHAMRRTSTDAARTAFNAG